jgi:hypothetical protein
MQRRKKKRPLAKAVVAGGRDSGKQEDFPLYLSIKY